MWGALLAFMQGGTTALAAPKGQADHGAVADFSKCALPAWPKDSLRDEEEGAVTLSFLIGASGKVMDSKVLKSSGYPALDKAAADGLGRCKFVAAVKNGVAQEGWMKMQYVWSFDDARTPESGMALYAEKRYKAAFKILLPFAKAGNMNAQRTLGEMFLLGLGVAADPAAAFEWTERAAQAGDKAAQYNLAHLYLNGRGVGQSRPSALSWYVKSAAQGYMFAQRRLGELYADNNANESLFWYNEARKNGDAVAQQRYTEAVAANEALRRAQIEEASRAERAAREEAREEEEEEEEAEQQRRQARREAREEEERANAEDIQAAKAAIFSTLNGATRPGAPDFSGASRSYAQAMEREKARRDAADAARDSGAAKARAGMAERERQGAREREREQAEAASRARAADEQRARQARETEQLQAKKRAAELQAQKVADEQAEQRRKDAAAKEADRVERQNYLAEMRRGIRLGASKCPDGEGHYYVAGTKPRIKGGFCIDVAYEASCRDGRSVVTGVAKNFIGMNGCFGDTYKLDPKPACPVAEVSVRVTDVQPGCN